MPSYNAVTSQDTNILIKKILNQVDCAKIFMIAITRHQAKWRGIRLPIAALHHLKVALIFTGPKMQFDIITR